MSDEWDFYFSTLDGRPASTFLDLGLAEAVPLERLPEATWLSIRLRAPRADGLSSREEYLDLVRVEDELTRTVSLHSERLVYTGRSTSAGQRNFLFYSDNGAWAESVLSSTLVAFPDYEHTANSQGDADWSAYFQILHPSQRQVQLMRNRQVIEQLEELGDRSEVVREVTHWLYFEFPEQRDDLCAEVLARGYRELDRGDDGEAPRPFSLQLGHDIAAEASSIDRATLELYDLAESAGGEYDGWETQVESDDVD